MKRTYKISVLVIVFVLLATASNAFAKVRTVTFRVQGMTCEMCAASLQPELKSRNGFWMQRFISSEARLG